MVNVYMSLLALQFSCDYCDVWVCYIAFVVAEPCIIAWYQWRRRRWLWVCTQVYMVSLIIALAEDLTYHEIAEVSKGWKLVGLSYRHCVHQMQDYVNHHYFYSLYVVFRFQSKPQVELSLDQVSHWVKSMEHLPQIDPRKKELFEARFLIQNRGGGSNPLNSPTTDNLITKVGTILMTFTVINDLNDGANQFVLLFYDI